MFKFKFKPLSIEQVESTTRQRLQALQSNKELLNKLGDAMIKDIQFTARRGVNPVTGGRFIPLSKKWIKERKQIAQATPTHEAFKENRSNITITGQLLDSLARSSVGKTLTVFFQGIHKPYKAKRIRNPGKGLRTIGKEIDNELLARYVNKIRPFFGVRDKLLPQLKSIVIRFIRRNL